MQPAALPEPGDTGGGDSQAEEGDRKRSSPAWACDVSLVDSRRLDASRVSTSRQVTDAYLLALAVAHGGRLVTFDRGVALAAVPGATAEHLVTL
jgi:predicted nucleic acid-binding protein